MIVKVWFARLGKSATGLGFDNCSLLIVINGQ